MLKKMRPPTEAARKSEHVTPCEQYNDNHDHDRYGYLTGGAVEKATVFRVTGLHCHSYLLG
jgi:hypothetical protein